MIAILKESFLGFIQFLWVLLSGALIAVLVALPWLLRGAAVLAWFAAGYVAIMQIQQFYAPTVSSPIPVLALQFAAILILLAWPVVGLLQRKKEYVWGLLATGALVVGGLFWKGIPWFRTTWPETADLVLRLFPSALFMVLMISATLRLKWLYSIGGVKLASPAFVWFKHTNVSLVEKDDAVSMESAGIENQIDDESDS